MAGVDSKGANPNKLWLSHPRKFGKGSRKCKVCLNGHGLIRKYGLGVCRQCFHEIAPTLGFQKLD